MKLILSCITKGEDQTRHTLDRLAQAGIGNHAIVVVHPGSSEALEGDHMLAHPAATSVSTAHKDPTTAPPASTAGAAASGSAVGGMFGWIVGYGVLSLPGALLGGAVGAVAGAAINATRHAMSSHLTDEVQHHYASRIVDDHAAVLVQVQDAAQYQAVLMLFLEEGGRHILTSRNNPALAESAQLDELVHHSTDLDGSTPSPRISAVE